MVGKACSSRLQKEYRALLTEPRPNIEAHPRADNILEWHYVLTGPADSPYVGGVYHGKVIFPGDYPFKAPSIVMCTPSGRFAPNAKICMSMTDYHPESWQPAWSVGTILTGLLSFMLEEAPTSGSVNSTAEEKQHLAAQSLDFNVANLQFRRLFPGWVEQQQERKQQQQEGQPGLQEQPRKVPLAGSLVQEHRQGEMRGFHLRQRWPVLLLGAILVSVIAFILVHSA